MRYYDEMNYDYVSLIDTTHTKNYIIRQTGNKLLYIETLRWPNWAWRRDRESTIVPTWTDGHKWQRPWDSHLVSIICINFGLVNKQDF